jgi:cell division septal protein FtsQ
VKKIVLPVTFFLIVIAIFLPGFLIKARIDCRSQYGECPQTIIDGIAPLQGKSIFFAQKGLKKYLKSDFLVSGESIQFKLPNILRVDLVVKKPIYALGSSTLPAFDLIDKDGQILAQATSSDLPTVLASIDLLPPGEKVSPTYLLALELTDGVHKMYQVRSSVIEGNTLLVDMPGGVRVIFPLDTVDRDLLLGSLRLIYSNIQKDGVGLYSQIDLRYKNPVLR